MGKYASYVRFGYGKSDLTPLYNDPESFKSVCHDLATPFVGKGITKVLALDAQGFALGAGVALHLKAGLIFIRKGGKIAWETQSLQIRDYSGSAKVLEIAVGALLEIDKVLVVDDWSETGAQLRGAICLAEQVGATVIGAAAIHMDDRVLRDERLSGYMLHQVE
jgi:adenine phosphoribosyltransferase